MSLFSKNKEDTRIRPDTGMCGTCRSFITDSREYPDGLCHFMPTPVNKVAQGHCSQHQYSDDTVAMIRRIAAELS